MIASMDAGGAEQLVLQFTADSLSRGDQAAVASAGGAWTARLESEVRHFDIPLVARSRFAVLSTAWRLRAVVRDVRPDVVHTHNVGVTVALRLAMVGMRKPAPVVTTLHGLAHADYPTAARALARTGSTVVACAPAVSRALEAVGFPPARCRTIVNGAARTPASAERIASVRSRLELSPCLVLGLGRLVDQKAWPILIEAAQAFPEDVDVVVAGDGPLRRDLERLAAEAGGRVRFVGVVDDVAALLGAVTCLVSTSDWEGLPLSLLEALSLGVPSVVTRVDGVVDVVPPGVAVLVEPRDAAAVAAEVCGLLADPTRRSSLTAAALASRSRWSPESMLEAYQMVYGEVSGR